jgi:phage terminase small subunit
MKGGQYMPPAMRKIYTEESEVELLEMTRDEVTEGMNDKEVLFCEYFMKNYNIKTAAIKAGYNKKSAHMAGYKVRRRPLVNRYIAWLKLHVSKECHVDAVDIIELYMRIAFADVTDFIKIDALGKIKLVPADEIDGQIVKQIKQGRDGITIELHDKMRALEKLERYFDVMPADWKQRIEEEKLKIMQQHLEIEKYKAGQGDDTTEDDGFIEAIKGVATEIWSE